MPTGGSGSRRPHRAARLEDRFYSGLARWLRRRGWVTRVEPYTGYGTPSRVRVLARTLLAAPGTLPSEVAERGPESAQRAVRGWRSFLTAQDAGAAVTVTVAGPRGSTSHCVTADRGGYVDALLDVDLMPGWREVSLSIGGHSVTAPVLVVGPDQTTALLSDIDDTVMVTALPRPLLAAWNGLVLHENARRAVPGMADLYRRWLDANPGAPTFYLSTGAWNVAPALRRFLSSHGFPAGPLLLTDWGPTSSGWFRSGRQHKRESLRRLIEELPQIRWVLVGDDGQHDPQIYRDVATEHPDRVALIAIRQLTPTERLLSHGTPGPATADDVAQRAPTPLVVHGGDGNVLALRLIDAGIL